MVIDDSDDEGAHGGAGVGSTENVEGDAYRESLTSVDGFRRGPNGKVKFNKDTKKRRREAEDADDDVVMADAVDTHPRADKKSKHKAAPKLGHEFKAKVSCTCLGFLVTRCSRSLALCFQKAGGDVKKGGVDPYAYMPLSQAAKKQNRGGRIGIAGKR